MKRIFILIIVVIVLIVASIFFLRVDRVDQSTQKAGAVLRVGMLGGWAPFMSINAQGEFEGLDVDVAREMGRRLGREVEILDLGSMPALLLALEQGSIDCVMTGLDITQERQKRYNLVRYTGGDMRNLVLVFWGSIPGGVLNLEDLKNTPNAVIGVEAGSSQEAFAKTITWLAKKPMDSVADMLIDLQYGRSTAILLEPRIARRYQKQRKELVFIDVPLPQAFQVAGCGIALRKDDTQLTDGIQRAVSTMRRDGTLRSFEQKWQLEE